MNYYISDTHFFHKNIVGISKNFDKRPYDTLEEMHEDMKNKWNNVVTNADHVYILGDMTWKATDEAIELVRSLNGNKHLILGNHDFTHNNKLKNLFVEVTHYKEMKDKVNGVEYNLVLSHYPIMFWNKQHSGAIHLYGHVHNTKEHFIYQDFITQLNKNGIKCSAYNVGCMFWDYTPVTLEQILRGK